MLFGITTFNLIAFGKKMTFNQMSTRSNGNQEQKLQEILYKKIESIIILSKNLSGQQPIMTD